MTQERLTALEDVAALATIGATYPELMLYLQAEMAKCEQALAAQPEQEPVAVVDEVIHAAWSAGFIEGEKAALAQPEQEPLGWLDGNDKLAQFMHRDLKADHDKRGSATPREYTIPVYAAPPQRPWQGLTEEEFLEACQLAELGNYLVAFQRIQTKLKERNNGP